MGSILKLKSHHQIMIKSITVDELVNLPMKIPEFQRYKDDAKIDEIIKYQTKKFNKDIEIPHIGVLSIAVCEEQNYLIDGQHRYCAFAALAEQYDFDVNVQFYECGSMKDVYELYTLININTPLPNVYLADTPKKVYDYFYRNYPAMLKSSVNCRRPNLYIEYLKEDIVKIFEIYSKRFSENIAERIIEDLELVNQSYKRAPNNLATSTVSVADKHGLYLGCGRKLNDTVHYEFTSKLLDGCKKASISEEVANKVKGSYFNVCIKPCLSCGVKLHRDDAHCGFIISKYNGGKAIADNLIPVCAECDKEMTIGNICEYRDKHYPIK